MMGNYHTKFPHRCFFPAGQTDFPPITSHTGAQAQQLENYLINYLCASMMYMYEGPPELAINPADGTHYVSLSGPEKTDTSNLNRNLLISFLGWPTNLGAAGGGAESAWLKWTPPGGAAQTLYQLDVTTGDALTVTITYGDKLSPSGTRYAYYDIDGDPLIWTPDGATLFESGTITTQNFQLAAMSIWEMPMRKLTAAQESVTYDSMTAGQAIKGKGNTANLLSLGGLCQRVADTDDHIETVERMTRRLWQHGHPIGTWTDSTSYINMMGGTTDANSLPIMWKPRKMTSTGDTVVCRPFATVTATNNGGDCYIRYTNNTNADVWTWTGSNLTAADIDYTDGTPATGIDFTSASDNEFDIDIKVDAGEELTVHKVGIAEGPWPY